MTKRVLSEEEIAAIRASGELSYKLAQQYRIGKHRIERIRAGHEPIAPIKPLPPLPPTPMAERRQRPVVEHALPVRYRMVPLHSKRDALGVVDIFFAPQDEISRIRLARRYRVPLAVIAAIQDGIAFTAITRRCVRPG